MRDHLLITRGALYGLIVSYVLALFAIGWISYVSFEISSERADRIRQVNATLAIDCHRINAIAKPSRDLFKFVLLLDPQPRSFRIVLRHAVKALTPLDCSRLPVFK